VKVYILRGISGVGKSTYARHLKSIVADTLICSADDEMDHGNGYQFDGRRVEDAHKNCLRKFIDGVQKRWSMIVLDNTNILYHHFDYYIKIAEAFGYEVEIVTITVDPQVAAERTTHNVPLKSLLSRQKALTDDIARTNIPARIKQRTVCAGSPTWERWGR